MTLDEYDHLTKLERDLMLVFAAQRPTVLEDGTREWDLAGRKWKARPFVDPSGRTQTPVMPGIYQDEDGFGHFNIPELLRVVELEQTEENIAILKRALDDAAAEAGVSMEWSE